MNRFIGIRLPADLKGMIASFRASCGYSAAEPYITLISPALLEGVPLPEQKLDSFCLSQVEFSAVVAGVGLHRDQLLYLTVLPGAISLFRDQLVRHLRINPDGKAYRPHITLLRRDDSLPDMDKAQAGAKAIFTNSVTIKVEEITLFEQHSSSEPFSPTHAFPFTGRK